MPLRDMLRLFAWFLLAAVLVGFAERAVPALDVVAAFRLHLAVLAGSVALAALAARAWRAALPALLAAALAAATLGPWWRPAERPAAAPGIHVKILAANLYYANPTPEEVGRALVAADADILLTFETTRRMVAGAVAAHYPYRVVTSGKRPTLRSTAWSRFPLEDASVNLDDSRGPQSVSAVADLGSGVRLGLIGVHFLRGADGKRARQIDGIGRLAASIGAPLVIAGDFNAPPWSVLAGEVAERTGTVINGGHRVTWRGYYPPLGLPAPFGHQIDEVLVSPQIGIASIRTVPLPGSDHLGVLTELVVPAAGEAVAAGAARPVLVAGHPLPAGPAAD